MRRITVIGAGPLLDQDVRMFSGQCLRTWHLVKPLLDAGHKIDLFLVPIPDEQPPPPANDVAIKANFQGLDHFRLLTNNADIIRPYIQKRMRRFKPQVILGINPYPASIAASLNTEKPIWCDLNGYAMVEGQTRARVYDDDESLAHFWRHELACVRRGDKFSVVSDAQHDALLGELAAVGRLNQYTFDYNFAHKIMEAVPESTLRLNPDYRKREDDTFNLMWCGGYNTWTDVDLLYDVLQQAMDEIPDLYFISTGGAVYGHDDKTYHRFVQKVEAGKHAERFTLLGWVEPKIVDAMLMQADLGITIDARNTETIFGARHRILTMLGCGLPVLTTLGPEITYQLHERGLGYFARIGDTQAMLNAIKYAAGHRDELKELGRKSREFVVNEYTYENTTTELLNWLNDPLLAPDNEQRFQRPRPKPPLRLQPLNGVESEWGILENYSLEALVKDYRTLEKIRAHPVYRFAKKMKSIAKGGRSYDG